MTTYMKCIEKAVRISDCGWGIADWGFWIANLGLGILDFRSAFDKSPAGKFGI
jgi:hypothetical protein